MSEKVKIPESPVSPQEKKRVVEPVADQKKKSLVAKMGRQPEPLPVISLVGEHERHATITVDVDPDASEADMRDIRIETQKAMDRLIKKIQKNVSAIESLIEKHRCTLRVREKNDNISEQELKQLVEMLDAREAQKNMLADQVNTEDGSELVVLAALENLRKDLSVQPERSSKKLEKKKSGKEAKTKRGKEKKSVPQMAAPESVLGEPTSLDLKASVTPEIAPQLIDFGFELAPGQEIVDQEQEGSRYRIETVEGSLVTCVLVARDANYEGTLVFDASNPKNVDRFHTANSMQAEMSKVQAELPETAEPDDEWRALFARCEKDPDLMLSILVDSLSQVLQLIAEEMQTPFNAKEERMLARAYLERSLQEVVGITEESKREQVLEIIMRRISKNVLQ